MGWVASSTVFQKTDQLMWSSLRCMILKIALCCKLLSGRGQGDRSKESTYAVPIFPPLETSRKPNNEGTLGLQFHFDLSGNCTPPLDSYSHETSVCSTCRHCIGSIRGLITGMWKFMGFDGFACSFKFDSIFLRFWMIFRMVLRFLMDPKAPLLRG